MGWRLAGAGRADAARLTAHTCSAGVLSLASAGQSSSVSVPLAWYTSSALCSAPTRSCYTAIRRRVRQFFKVTSAMSTRNEATRLIVSGVKWLEAGRVW